MMICRSVILKMTNFPNQILEKIKTPSLGSITFSEDRSIYEVMW